MSKIYYLFFLILFLNSCYSNNNIKYCASTDLFNINIISNDLSRMDQKLVLNKLINESSIKFNQDSNLLIDIRIVLKRNTSLISINNTVQMENLNFIVYYNIKDKVNNLVLDKSKIIIVDDLNVSDNRFANYATNNYIIDNFAKNLSIKLESKVRNFLANKKCKKIQNQVAIYYFNANINLKNTKGSRYV